MLPLPESKLIFINPIPPGDQQAHQFRMKVGCGPAFRPAIQSLDEVANLVASDRVRGIICCHVYCYNILDFYTISNFLNLRKAHETLRSKEKSAVSDESGENDNYEQNGCALITSR